MTATEPSGNAQLPQPPALPDRDATGAGTGARGGDTHIGWIRALLSGLAILVVGFGAVLGANRILTKALALRRTPREVLATVLFFVVVLVLAWVLRRLQDRKLI